MAATLEMGSSSSEVKELQLKLNKAFGSKVVEPSGSYDEETRNAVGRLQGELGVPTSGKYDARTAKALDEALLPAKEVQYKGKTYMLSRKEYDEVSAMLIKQLKAPAQSYVNMSKETRSLWNAHDQARKNNVVFSWIVATATGVKFPNESVIKGAESAAKAMQSAVSSGDLNAATKALEGKASEPIRQAFADMDQYREELYGGSGQLIEELNKIRSGCELILTICAVIVPGGFVVQAAVAGGLGSYKTLLSEIDKAGIGDSKQTVGTAFGRILINGAVEGGLAYILKGPAGKAGLNSIASGAVKAVTGKAVSKIGASALQQFAVKSLEGGLEKASEEFIKDLVKSCDPNEKMTADQAFAKIGENFAEGAAFKQLEEALGGFAGKGAEKYFKKVHENFIKGKSKDAIDLDDAFKNGGGKVVEAAYDKYSDEAVKSSGGDPAKAQAILEKKIVEDPALKKWFADYEKKNGKK